MFCGEGQRGDASLVGMGCDGIVGNTDSDPVGAFLSFALADQIHDPYLLGVAEREGLTFGGIAVFVDEGNEPLDGFAGGLTALEGDIDEGTIVDADGVPKGFAAAPSGLTDGDLVLVHISHYGIGVGNLRDGSLWTSGIPVLHFAHRAFRVIGSRDEMQEAVHAVGVRSIGDDGTTIRGGIFAN